MSNEQNESDAKAHPVDTIVTLSVPDAFESLKKAMLMMENLIRVLH